MDNASLLALSAPLFVLLVVIEMIYYRLHPDENASGYGVRDTAASFAVGAGAAVVDILYKSIAVAVFVVLYELTPLRVEVTWVTFPLILLAQDFCYYWMHREHHMVRVLWASHVVHHSSRKYNFSTSVRQPWTGLTSQIFYIPLALAGVPPWAILLCGAINMLTQFWLHTDRIGKLPGYIQRVINTPSSHRVHHASQGGYLDRNFGGILMIWDQMFGTWAEEKERPTYGLTKNIDTYNPLRIVSHEYVAIGRDVARATRWQDRVRHLLGRPGWQPEPTALTPGTGPEPAPDLGPEPEAPGPCRRCRPDLATGSRCTCEPAGAQSGR
ncbi:sterol desaturase family protein [Streptomyces sp. NPDC004311]|uniref:sterol desaturase family protein n=1 Tax=Streptomyces sp. NPDC004311 TaxID=3364698 RepID=UPI0036C1F3AA